MREIDKNKLLRLLNQHRCFGIQYIDSSLFSSSNFEQNEQLPNQKNILDEYIYHCDLCELSKLSQKKLGSGKLESEYVFLNTTNNNEEYDSFDSEFLKKTTQDLGIAVEDIYVTSLVKCVLQNQQGIDIEEIISKCKQYFFQELTILNPKYLFCTVESASYILKIKKDDYSIVGKCFKLNETLVFPIYSSGFLKKNPSYQEEMKKSLNKIKGFIC